MSGGPYLQMFTNVTS